MTLKRVQTTDRNLQAIQDNVEQALVPLQSSPLSGGVFLASLQLNASITGTTTSGSPTVTSVSSFTNVMAGQSISGSGIPAGTTIVSTNASAGSITLSANATASASGVSLLCTGDNLISHKLKRVPSTWVILRINANVTIWEALTSKLKDSSGKSLSANDTYLNLNCTGSATISLWVN